MPRQGKKKVNFIGSSQGCCETLHKETPKGHLAGAVRPALADHGSSELKRNLPRSSQLLSGFQITVFNSHQTTKISLVPF